ncbi:PadR family transcriptional regulator [Lacticaseibacillus baoqingensis]|uniref:PadR family transcriptional regulator n=1 Tax=Lacticaseibacillus baoqingensis TaxID=2486013 RepID=A0ABW4E5A2_9LACO|nr:PadR family transcriptional regulator [Lacticaseibacillus baoqingensis]
MAQRNILQFIILGLVTDQPRTGYELTKAFDNDIGEFWSAQHSQIYPQLKTLEAKGWLTHTEEITGEKLNRKRYAATKSGKAALNDWLTAASEPVSGAKDEFVLKLYFIHDQTDARLKPMLTTQLIWHEQRRDHLRKQLATKFPNGADALDFGHFLILEHALHREEEYCQWLQAALAQLPGGMTN